MGCITKMFKIRCHQCWNSFHCKNELKKHLINCVSLEQVHEEDKKENINNLKKILTDLNNFNEDLKLIEIPVATRVTTHDNNVDTSDEDISATNKHLAKQQNDTSSQASTSSNNGDDSMKFTCNLCKQRFDDRMSLSKHQRTEMLLKMEKKKKETRKKKLRDLHFKHKIDLSYIETTQLNNLTQQIADNLAFCIDGMNYICYVAAISCLY
jgi:hypothetical protein